MESISGQDLATLRQHGTTIIRNIVLFMDNPFAYADKLEEAGEQFDLLLELREELGLEGDNVALGHTSVPEMSHNSEIGQFLVQQGIKKLEQFLNNIGGQNNE